VFAWDSPHHLGTCGLQARDFALLGFASAELIIATGVSEVEVPHARFALAPVKVIPPGDLATRAGEFVSTEAEWPNELYPRLAAIAQPGYTDAKVPLHPARAARDLGEALPAGGLLTAEPGVAGLWVARTFPTPALASGEPRRVTVPAHREPGAAARAAIGAASAGRPAVFVTSDDFDRATREAIAEATDRRLDLAVVRWRPTGSLERADDHLGLLAQAIANPGVSVVDVPVALEDTARLVEAAGEIVAWGGLRASS
jgi:hypothetical protein